MKGTPQVNKRVGLANLYLLRKLLMTARGVGCVCLPASGRYSRKKWNSAMKCREEAGG
jgi:hypothetical protein